MVDLPAGFRTTIAEGIPDELPAMPAVDNSVDHAPNRRQILSHDDKQLALRNALRYFDPKHHGSLLPEFLDELNSYGRIIMRRFRPTTYEMKAYPLEAYPAKTPQAAAIMLMIQNNLDPAVAQFPHELITYGGNGSVFQNWAQYRLAMKYLSMMTEEQTLVMSSGHPLGLFPSSPEAPRVVVTNGMVIPNYSSQEEYERMNALGVTQYGQMTAGSYMYIGPQGIVHGTTITLLNAARQHLQLDEAASLAGVTFITSGLGGMSGAQAKAATIAGASCIIAETNKHAAHKRHEQGWLTCVTDSIDAAIDMMVSNAEDGKAIPLGSSATLWNCGNAASRETFALTWVATKPASTIRTKVGIFLRIEPTRKVHPCFQTNQSNSRWKFNQRCDDTQRRSTQWQTVACISGTMEMHSCWRRLGLVQMC